MNCKQTTAAITCLIDPKLVLVLSTLETPAVSLEVTEITPWILEMDVFDGHVHYAEKPMAFLYPLLEVVVPLFETVEPNGSAVGTQVFLATVDFDLRVRSAETGNEEGEDYSNDDERSHLQPC